MRAGADGTVVEVTRGTADRPMETPNYPCFHPSGDLYVSDSGEWDHDTGRVYRVRADGSTDLVSEAPRFFANGMCFDAAAEWLYVVESQMPGVSRLRVLPDGTLGERQVVATLPGDVPDGVQFDSEGTLYITLYTPSRIYQLEPSGRIQVLVDDPHHTKLSSPTNIVFGGPNRTDLFTANLGRWHINRLRMSVPGIPLPLSGADLGLNVTGTSRRGPTAPHGIYPCRILTLTSSIAGSWGNARLRGRPWDVADPWNLIWVMPAQGRSPRWLPQVPGNLRSFC